MHYLIDKGIIVISVFSLIQSVFRPFAKRTWQKFNMTVLSLIIVRKNIIFEKIGNFGFESKAIDC